MSVALRIPEGYLGLAKLLLALSDQQADELVNGLRKAQTPFSYLRAARGLAQYVPSVQPAQLTEVVEALFALYVVMATREMTSSDFVQEFLESARQQIPDANIDESVRDRLKRLFGIEQLAVATKAKLIITEHQHSLCQARLFTDIRPVFPQNPSESPAALVLVHTLKITYHQGRELKEFFLAMDSDDLNELRVVLDRASQKAESLKKHVHPADVGYLDV